MQAGGKPSLLAYASVARLNPFQSLLYQSFPDMGFAVAPFHKPLQVNDLLLHRNRVRHLVLHLHWLNWLLRDVTDQDAAYHRIAAYVGRLQNFQRRGGKVVWTVHNLYPHDSHLLDAEIHLQNRIAETADVIHTMSRATPAALEHHTPLDAEKILHSPHPSYAGAYENYVSRHEARSVLGIDGDEFVFLVFGALKEYKGLNQTLDAFDRLCERTRSERRVRLLVAGGPDGSDDVRAFLARAFVHPRVLVEPTSIPSARAQYYLNAADAGLVTYRRTLNSGAGILYQSFGIPIVANDVEGMREVLPEEGTVFVDTHDERAFPKALETMMHRAPVARKFLGAPDNKLPDPAVTSRLFVQGLAERLG